MTLRRLLIGIAVPVLLLSLSAAPCFAETACFQDKVTGFMNLDCIRLNNSNGGLIEYRCWDNETEDYVVFDPGDRWLEIPKEKCLKIIKSIEGVPQDVPRGPNGEAGCEDGL